MHLFGRASYGGGITGVPPISWGGRRSRRRPRLRRITVLSLVFAPSILATFYYGLVATDRYVSEAAFLLRSGNRVANMAGLSSLLTILGVGRSQGDAHAVYAFLTSREAVWRLAEHVPIAAMYNDKDADALSRYPNLLFPATDESLYRYMQIRLTVKLDEMSGVETLRIEAFSAKDALGIALALLDLAEQQVNRLNERSERDAVGHAADDLKLAEARLIDSQIALTAFRNRELMIDAGQNAAALVEIIVKLSTSLADTRVQIAEQLSVAAGSPQLAPLRAQEQALVEQINRERSRVSPGEDALAAKIAEFERLELQHGFAERAVEAAMAALELARSDARRQHVFLERVVAPNLADESRAPRRLETIVTVFGLNAIGCGVAWLLIAGLREHSRAAPRE